MQTRTEKDTHGEIEVPAACYWGAQTQRSLTNFDIGQELMPLEVIHAYARIKQAAADANCELGELPADKAALIRQVCEEIAVPAHKAT